ncbi:FMN-dependent L-lactate dehydrogenase LldD [Novosphingobium sp.]|uniref:FMN-dependent L-lactate dehydrogenase LldD n=1 Tax=Novosphingobium sp. TaxID=1874826 RepID=UPI00260A015D|nr:FMN-dependent L-lactate dehydrogenase LldD [Novosphingobium sp.]
MIVSSPEDFREAARRRLPRFLFDYLDGGAGGEETLRRNQTDLAGHRLRQRVLVDVSGIDLRTTLFGQDLAMPVMLGPVGLGGMYARRGEVQAARAAGAAGVPFCLSTVALCGLDEVIAGSGAPPWFQLYVIKDRGFLTDLLDHAWAAGCRNLVFTVDMPVPGVRYRDRRSGMSGPFAAARRLAQACTSPGWAIDVGLLGRPHRLGNLAPVLGRASGMNDYMGWLGANFDPAIAWRDLDWIRARWPGALVIKGILDPDDADAAARLGADGIIVSNHGGRQLDGAPSTASALPAIADRVAERLTVLADSGVRNGRDVARMLALGAKGVLLGRAWVYALATGGEAGVTQLLAMIERELAVTMSLCGARSVAQLNRDVLAG